MRQIKQLSQPQTFQAGYLFKGGGAKAQMKTCSHYHHEHSVTTDVLDR